MFARAIPAMGRQMIPTGMISIPNHGDPVNRVESMRRRWARSLLLESPFRLHYDENLARLPLTTGQ